MRHKETHSCLVEHLGELLCDLISLELDSENFMGAIDGIFGEIL